MMKHIKSINEGWFTDNKIVKTILKDRPRPLWKIIERFSKIIFPKVLIGTSPILDKYIDGIVVETFNHEEDNTCYLIIKTNILVEDDLTENRMFSISANNNVISFEGFNKQHPITMSYPIRSEEDIKDVIKHFANKLKPYLERVFEFND